MPGIQCNPLSSTLPISTIKFDVTCLLKQPVVPQTVIVIRMSITLTGADLHVTLETRFERSGSFPGPCSRRMLQGHTACDIMSGPDCVTVPSVPPPPQSTAQSLSCWAPHIAAACDLGFLSCTSAPHTSFQSCI